MKAKRLVKQEKEENKGNKGMNNEKFLPFKNGDIPVYYDKIRIHTYK